MPVNRVKSIVAIVICIFLMGSCVPFIRSVSEPIGVAGLVVCSLVLVSFLIPLIRDIQQKK